MLTNNKKGIEKIDNLLGKTLGARKNCQPKTLIKFVFFNER